jgi:L-malate glycosyltransferase
MHIVILPSWYRYNEVPGSGIFFRDQAVALAKEGCHVTILFAEPRSLRSFTLRKFFFESHFQINESNYDNVREYIFKGWNPLIRSSIGRKIWIWIMFRLFCSYIRKYGKPDIVHVHSVLWAGVVASMIYKKFNIPYVVTEHSTGFIMEEINPALKPTFYKIGSEASMFFTVGELLAKKVSDFCPIIVTTILPNFVDVAFFRNISPVKYFNRGEFIFFSLGNLLANKGYDILLSAFKKAFKGDFNIKLKIGGQGELAADLKAMTKVLGIEKQITFLGHLNRIQIREQLQSSDSFVLASRIETFGIVFIEAMACGLPVIGTRCGGPEGFILPDCGYLVAKEDVDQLACALQWMVENRKQFDEERISEYVTTNFDSAVLAKVLLKYYEKCLKEYYQ